MRSHWLAGVACVGAFAFGGVAAAQVLPTGVVTTVDLSDGTKVVSTILSPTSQRIELTGGPTFGPNPATVNVDNLSLAGAEVLYSGTVVTRGTTTPFNCRLNTATKSVSGDEICGAAFGGQAPAAPTTPTTPVTPTTPPTVTTTENPNGTTTTTVTTPNATVTTTAPQEIAFVRNVQAEQFLLSLVADRISVANAQNYIASRLQAMALAGLAPGGLSLGRAGGGMAAGEGPGGLTPGVWFNASGASLKDRRIGAGVSGHDASAVVGADLSGDTFTVGVFATYGDMKLDGRDSLFESDGWTGGLYGRWTPSSLVRLTATVGAGTQDVLFDRTSGALRSRGRTDRESRFGSVSVDSQLPLGPRLIAVPSAGVLFSSSDTDAYTDQAGRRIAGADSDLSLGTLGTTVFYQAAGFLPFAQASLNHQFNKEPGVDRTYAMFGAGVAAPVGRAASLVFTAQTIAWKSQEREARFNITLRRNF